MAEFFFKNAYFCPFSTIYFKIEYSWVKMSHSSPHPKGWRLSALFFVNQYMMFENFARKLMGDAASKAKKILTKQPVLITKVSGEYIIYHKLNCYGSDGSMWSIDKKAYKAKINAKTVILDWSENPSKAEKQNMDWLKGRTSGTEIGYAVLLSANGNVVSKIEGMYFA